MDKKKEKRKKSMRVLDIFEKILDGEKIEVDKLAVTYSTTPRTIERDISNIKDYFIEKGEFCYYDRKKKGYLVEGNFDRKLTQSEALAVSKILLDSRAFSHNKIKILLDKIIKNCTSVEDYKELSGMLENEKHHYLELTHYKEKRSEDDFLDNLYEYGNAIRNQNKMKIRYVKMSGEEVDRIICPVGLMFSEYYFYLLGNIENIDKKKFKEDTTKCPTIYRLDRIRKVEILEEKFKNIYYKDKFQEGEFRKKIHFMTGGKERKIEFLYSGTSLEAVLDKIPSAELKEKIDNKNGKKKYRLTAKVFEDGFNRWLKSQGNDVEILKW